MAQTRIVVGGISHETNTFSTSPTGLEAFRILRGEDLYRDEAIKSLVRRGIDVIPTLYASALPSGLVEKDAYVQMKESLLGQIEAVGRVDGVCLFLHGALEVEGIGDGESDLAKNVREIVGEDVLISVSLDLHGNISPELLDFADILTAYRTAPHIDSVETKVRAALLLADCIKKNMKPVSVLVKPPVLLPGEMVVTDVEPASGLYRKLREIDESSCVLNSSLLVGMAWADTPSAGASVIIVAESEDSRDEAYLKCCDLARDYWDKRSEFRLEVDSGSIDETIRMAKAYPKKPVFISDSGDNVTAGGAGDISLFAERLISLDVTDAVVAAIVDPDAVTLCKRAGVDNSLKVEIGGKLDIVNGYPLEIEGKVVNLSEDGAVIRASGLDIILTAQRRAFTTLDSFKSYGIDPLDREIVVVKLGYLFPELRGVVAKALMAFSPGFTNLLLDELDYKNVKRPIYPLDKDFSWEPP